MSPLPLRTSTLIFQGAGSSAAALLAWVDPWPKPTKIAVRSVATSAAAPPAATQRPSRRGGRRLDRQPGQAPGLAVVDPERGRVAKQREHSGLAGREAVEAAVLEPLDLVRPERRALGGLLDGQLALQAQRGQHGRLLGWSGV